MKTKSIFKKGIFILFLFLFLQGYSQITHTITLNVDTGQITRATTNRYSNFGQPASISNENFTIEVSVGDYVEWVGVSSTSEEDSVEILSINHEGGATLFGKNVINGANGIVIGKVTEGRGGDYEKYTIKFKVFVNGEAKAGIFIIDPKITIKR